MSGINLLTLSEKKACRTIPLKWHLYTVMQSNTIILQYHLGEVVALNVCVGEPLIQLSGNSQGPSL